MSFESVPVLDLSHARKTGTKPAFLSSLRYALLEVGFLYIKNTGLENSLIQDVVTEGKAFFDLSHVEKLKIQMKNKPSFLGYSLPAAETTAHHADQREQIDLSTPHPLPAHGAPLYHNLRAPNQWPSSSHLPSFRPTYENYIQQMSALSIEFTSLIAESLLLQPTAFDRFFDTDQQHKLKIIKYPDVSQIPEEAREGRQGVGPHKDSLLTSYLLQASRHKGLQAQNLRGEWVDIPPIDGTLVVAIGQGLEALTSGVYKSTTHRVLSPSAGSGPRFSIPFFQGVSYDSKFEYVDIPAEILRMRDEIKEKREKELGLRKDDIEFTFEKGRWGHLGEAALANRIKSHPDVGEIWYPELLEKIRREQREVAEMQKHDATDGKTMAPTSGDEGNEHQDMRSNTAPIQVH